MGTRQQNFSKTSTPQEIFLDVARATLEDLNVVEFLFPRFSKRLWIIKTYILYHIKKYRFVIYLFQTWESSDGYFIWTFAVQFWSWTKPRYCASFYCISQQAHRWELLLKKTKVDIVWRKKKRNLLPSIQNDQSNYLNENDSLTMGFLLLTKLGYWDGYLPWAVNQ